MVGFALTAKAQVGVNTTDPSATLDVVSSGTTSGTKALEINNSSNKEMVTVLDNGNVGIGTNLPTTKLDIENGTTAGAIKIVDGTQGVGKVLISDANGIGTWQVNTGAQNSLYQNIACNASTDFELPAGTEVTLPGFTPIIVPNAGKYELIFHSFFQNRGVDDSKSFYVHIYVNGVLYKAEETYGYVAQNAYLNSHYSVIVPIATPNSEIEVKIRAFISAPIYVNAAAGSNRNNLDIIYLGL